MPTLLADGRGVDLPFSELGVNHSFTLFLPTLLQLLHRFAAGAKTSGGPCALSADGRVARDVTTPVLEQAAGLCRRTVPGVLAKWAARTCARCRCPIAAGRSASSTAGTAAAANRARLLLWCRWKESNPRPSHYECAALPTELHRHLALPRPSGIRGKPSSIAGSVGALAKRAGRGAWLQPAPRRHSRKSGHRCKAG